MNPLLQLDEERFVRSLASQHMSIPPYFRRARDRNLDGAPTMPNAVREVNPTDFGELDKGGTTVIDAREPKAFAGSHVPRSLNIWLDGMSFFPGWVLDDDEPVALVTERPSDAVVACTYLCRLGFDMSQPTSITGFPIGATEESRLRNSRRVQFISCASLYYSNPVLPSIESVS
jgi:hydroxyacylglutathione hydrolase